MEAGWRFVHSGAVVLGTLEDAELQHVHGLMSRYWDRAWVRYKHRRVVGHLRAQGVSLKKVARIMECVQSAQLDRGAGQNGSCVKHLSQSSTPEFPGASPN